MSLALVRRGGVASSLRRTAFVPTNIASCVLWLDAGQIDGAVDGSPVATWQDRSGGVRNATQATVASQPVFRATAGPSGKSGLDFDAVDDGMITSLVATLDHTYFLVSNQRTSGNNRTIQGSNNWLLANARGDTSTKTTFYNGGGFLTSAATYVLSTFQTVTATQATAGSELRVNGVAVATGTAGIAPGTLSLAAAGGFAEPANGLVAEVLVYSRVLTLVEIERVESYLRVKHFIISDSFNRVDNAASIGVAESGQSWVPYVGTWAISSNAARCVTNDSAVALDAGIADVDITLAVLNMDAAKSAGIVFRLVDANNFMMWKLGEGGNIAFVLKSAGNFTALLNITTPAGRVNGTNILRVVAKGSALDGYLNGTLVASTTSTSFLTATRHGMHDHVGAPPLDDFSLVAAL